MEPHIYPSKLNEQTKVSNACCVVSFPLLINHRNRRVVYQLPLLIRNHSPEPRISISAPYHAPPTEITDSIDKKIGIVESFEKINTLVWMLSIPLGLMEIWYEILLSHRREPLLIIPAIRPPAQNEFRCYQDAMSVAVLP